MGLSGRIAGILVVFALWAAGAEWTALFNGKDLESWEPVGDGVWTVLSDGTLVGQRDPASLERLSPWPKNHGELASWLYRQAWLYTKREFSEFDLRLEYWARYGGNSGVSIRDATRARHAVSQPPDFQRTPARVGYEIQINNRYGDDWPSGSIYRFVKAPLGVQLDGQWNTLEIESRSDRIRVRLNGRLVAEHPGDPLRPKTGPIGLQLHDQFSVMMFRNLKIRKVHGR